MTFEFKKANLHDSEKKNSKNNLSVESLLIDEEYNLIFDDLNFDENYNNFTNHCKKKRIKSKKKSGKIKKENKNFIDFKNNQFYFKTSDNLNFLLEKSK